MFYVLYLFDKNMFCSILLAILEFVIEPYSQQDVLTVYLI